MTAPRRLPYAAAAFVAVALALALHTVRTAPTLLIQIATRRLTLSTLALQQEEQAARRAALQVFRQTGTTSELSLAQMAKELLPETEVALSPGDRAGLVEGLVRQRVQVALGEVPLAQAGRLLERIEQSPPWRVVELNVQPGPVAGRGRMVLGLEAVLPGGAP